MFIAIVGTRFSGKSTVEDYFVQTKGFTLLQLVQESSPQSSRQSLDIDSSEAEASLAQFIEYREQSLSTKHSQKHLSFLSLSPLPSPTPTSHKLATFTTPALLLEHVTRNWRGNFITSDLHSRDVLELFIRRPFFMVLRIDAPLLLRYQRSQGTQALSLEEFIQEDDQINFGEDAAPRAITTGSEPPYSLQSVNDLVDVQLTNQYTTHSDLYTQLETLDLLNPQHLRPGWDAYFMTLASLASQRSNCMKRRVGAVLVRENRLLSTGYNGTPRGLPNCNAGGCMHCNGATLYTDIPYECVCLHAEENALLEAGRERIGIGSVLYCNTCPCLRCTIKIIQTGVKEVVYNLTYKVDDASAKLFQQAGVKLRQYDPRKKVHLLGSEGRATSEPI